ncbi:hypothetical protein P3X46_029106 [Hevea brasiliensis]|uniref:Prolamin-like domain-containing protein n=1 Tax=Hevea brasiliensis TaxID=3981 RepID=A0ABQ9KR66_HEVBR|nr:egg cell-secreted protein 1.1-like [Hevea brasiliensis]KAJ9146891.1 hypothetical protein P3X46_029106 [Hevea brasiliensis]
MANIFKLFFFLVLLTSSMEFLAKAQTFSTNSNLLARLKLDDESSSCWDSLIQLQACSGEIILFFLNGETYLGHSCCEAIRIITKQCWPSMIDTLGFTTEEADILEGYCDRADGLPPPPTLWLSKAIARKAIVP